MNLRTLEYVIRRAVFSVLVVVTVALIAFLLIHAAPGDPAQLLSGEAATREQIQAIRKAYGLDRPLTEQLVIYLGDLFTGNLGYSITYARPVVQVIMERVPQTLLLAGSAISLAIAVGIFLGLISAAKPYSARDRLITTFGLTLYSVPAFWLGLVLIMGLALWIPLFPTGGMFDIGVQSDLLHFTANLAWHLFLPLITLASVFLGTYVLLTRAGLLEALGMNYIVQARAKGVSERTILHRHALKNALLPVITVAGIELGLAIGGVILTEATFSWPGVGSLLIQAVSHRDYSLVTGIFLMTAISVSVANFVADMIYAWIDPRIRTGNL